MRHHSGKGKSDDWMTPREILEPLGPFDLDPCTPLVQPWPTAARRYTLADNGLVKPWGGRVWMNPPYTRPAYSAFMRKMAEHNWGTSLIFARTDTEDFCRWVWERASALLFIEGRLFFHHPDGQRAAHNGGAPSVLCAYGADDADVLASCGIRGAFVPLLLPRFYAAVAMLPTWRDMIVDWVRRQPGPVAVGDLYKAFVNHPKVRTNRNWKAKLRQALQRGPFEPIERGVWRLA